MVWSGASMVSRKSRHRVYQKGIALLFLLLIFLCLSLCLTLQWKRKVSVAAYHGIRERTDNTSVHRDVRSAGEFVAAAQRVLSGERFFGDEIDMHLFVIWHGAYKALNSILNEIHSTFFVLHVVEFDWGSESEMIDGLWVLYSGKGGWERKGMPLKLRQCGYGRFLAVVVVDTRPEYSSLETAHGTDVVSTEMHSSKRRYRALSGGGFRVHGTYSTVEANHDLRVLFHTSPLEILAQSLKQGAESKNIISSFLKDPKRFRTDMKALGVLVTEWNCDDVLMALRSVSQVTLFDTESGALLWKRFSAFPEKPFREKEIAAVPCSDWPTMMRLQSTSVGDLWAAVSVLGATPASTATRVDIKSEFLVNIAGSQKRLRLEIIPVI